MSLHLRRPRWLIAAVILVNLIVVGLAVVTIDLDLRGRRQTVQASTRMVSGILVDKFSHYLQRIDLELQTIADEAIRGGELATTGDPATLIAFLDRHRARIPGLTEINLLDAEGRVVLSSFGTNGSLSLSVNKMAFFARLRDEPKAGLVVSRPVSDESNQQRLLLIGHRINLPDGGFGGVAMAVLPAAYLSEMFAAIHPDPGMHISLVNRQMEFIARHPAVAAMEGAAISSAVSDEIRALIEAETEAAPLRAISRLDGLSRTSFIRKVPGQPLFFSVGVADETYLKPWRAEGTRIGLVSTAFAVLSLLLTLAVRRNWAEREAAITSLEAAHTEIRSHAERLDMVLRGANDGWWDWNLLLDEIYVSPRWWEMLGHAPQGTRGPPSLWRSRTHPDDLPRVEADLARSLTSDQTTVQIEIRLRHAKGHYLPTLMRGYILRDFSGRALRMSGTSTDLTEIRRFEAILQAMFDLSPLGKCRTDPDGNILDVNVALLNTSGMSRTELIGTILPGIVPQPGPGEEGRRREHLDSTGTYGPFETVMHRPDGQTVAVRLRGVRIKADGGPDSIYTIVEDITDEKAIMQALEERTRDLARSNADLEQFAYVASHDLREPLRMVSGFLGLLERRYTPNLDAEGGQFIAFAKEGAQRMDRLILDLLDFSRIGRAGAPQERMQIKNAADQAIRNLAVGIEESGAEIEIDPILAEAQISGDPVQLTRLFQNLIGNALKYRNPDRSPQIHVTGQIENEMWKVSIADNGIGIEPEYFDRIFRIFQRLHTREQFEGTGIGLAVCRKIVEHHGGQIWIESIPGEGSTFTFTLPTDDN
ncbi:ATP-binding protein [Magnetospirillum molischianum]|uniref:histidine kinase n=1 Tax=Magnetospirillum molischianum DSM 120 TaxID=1150626 RepID=H8FPQ4_MAGML|nr:ATP-binding protein [Magnetospirillum molischianum]CCG40342.1 Putative two-component sensor histidine kinase, classical system [Magnetospirillum molischianum DSM 120]